MKRIVLHAVPVAIGFTVTCTVGLAEKIEWPRPDNSQPPTVRSDAGGPQAALWPPQPVPEPPPVPRDFRGDVIIFGFRS